MGSSSSTRRKGDTISSETPDYNGEIHVMLAGQDGTGRSTFVKRFVKGVYDTEYDPTIEDSFRKTIECDGKRFLLDILDVAGQEEYSAMHQTYMKRLEGSLLFFDVTSRSSFADPVLQLSSRWYPMFKRQWADYFSTKGLVLVATKADLESQRTVSSQEGQALAQEWGVPALLNSNVDQAFLAVVAEVVRLRAPARMNRTATD